MIDAARSRIKDIGGPPNAAAAQVLYELVMEESDYHNQLEMEESRAENEVCSVFETLLSSDTHTNNVADSDFNPDNFNALVNDHSSFIDETSAEKAVHFQLPDRE